MKLESLRVVHVEQRQNLHDADQRIIKALPKTAKAAIFPDLKAVFQTHPRVLDFNYLTGSR